MSGELQLIVRTGAAEPAGMDLSPGQPVGPLSIGRRGTWRLVAPGVLEEHGFVYFNGTDLFLQSTDPLSPVLADGAHIPGAWTADRAPCEIAVGGGRLWFGSPSPAFAPSPGGAAPDLGRQPFAPRVQGNDFEAATRVQPLEETRHARGPLPAAGSGFAAPMPAFGPPFGPGATPPLAPPPGVPITPPAPQQSFLAARWRETSGPKKALVFLMAPLIWAVWVIFTDPPVPPAPPKPATSATTSPSGAPRSGGSGAAPAPTEPPATAMEAPAASTSAKAGPSTAASGSPATTGPKTPQREAADAVAAGAFDRAARLYDELAKAHPEVPAYAEAARIMKVRMGKR